MPVVRVEFYGLARLRAGREHLEVVAETLAAALAAADRACPGLRSVRACVVSPEYLVSLNGEGFTAELTKSLTSGTVVVLLGAESGG